jgi:hypothetical protein
MDAWCALWFWPIEKAHLLPSRETWLLWLELILRGEVTASTAWEQIGLFEDALAQKELPLEAKTPGAFEPAAPSEVGEASAVFKLDWQGAPLKLQVFDPRDERLALKTSQAGRVVERAGIAEVGQLVAKAG